MKIETKEIRITLNDRELVLTREEAEALHKELCNLFGEKIQFVPTIREIHMPPIIVNPPPPTHIWPTYFPNPIICQGISATSTNVGALT